jgi:hypothetical protein
MGLHRDAFALVDVLAKWGSWRPLAWLDADPDLPEDAIAFVPGLVELGLVHYSPDHKSVRISIPGIAIVSLFDRDCDGS